MKDKLAKGQNFNAAGESYAGTGVTIIPENTPDEFAKAVIKLYSDKDFYDKCAENAKKLSDEVNWENEFGQLIKFEYTVWNQ